MDGRLGPFQFQFKLPSRFAEAVGELCPRGAEGGRGGMHVAQLQHLARQQANALFGSRHQAAALRARLRQSDGWHYKAVARQSQRHLQPHIEHGLTLDRLAERH